MSKRARARVESTTYDGPAVPTKKARLRARIVTDTPGSSSSHRLPQATRQSSRSQPLPPPTSPKERAHALPAPRRPTYPATVQPHLAEGTSTEDPPLDGDPTGPGVAEGDGYSNELDTVMDVVTEYWKVLMSLDVIYRLDTSTYVFQDWDEEEHSLQVCDSVHLLLHRSLILSKIGRYHHVTHLPQSPTEFTVHCTCPAQKLRGQCLHEQVMTKHAEEISSLPSIAPHPVPSAVLLCKTPFRDQLIFSCVSTVGRYASGK